MTEWCFTIKRWEETDKLWRVKMKKKKRWEKWQWSVWCAKIKNSCLYSWWHCASPTYFTSFEVSHLWGLLRDSIKWQEFMLHKPHKLDHIQDMANQQIISIISKTHTLTLTCMPLLVESQLMQTTNLNFDFSLVFPLIWLLSNMLFSVYTIVMKSMRNVLKKSQWEDSRDVRKSAAWPIPSMDGETEKSLSSPAYNESSVLKPTTAGCLVLLCSLD